MEYSSTHGTEGKKVYCDVVAAAAATAIEKKRKSMQVMLEVLRARNINVKEGKGTSVFVRYYVKPNSTGNGLIALNTKEVSASSKPEWRETLCLECGTQLGQRDIASALRSEFIVFEVRVRRGGLVGGMRGSKVLGRVEIAWRDLLDSPTLSIENWFPLSNIKTQTMWKDSINPPSLYLALSVRPPVNNDSNMMRCSAGSQEEKKKISAHMLISRRKVSPLSTANGESWHPDNSNVNRNRRTSRLERDACGCGGRMCINGHFGDDHSI